MKYKFFWVGILIIVILIIISFNIFLLSNKNVQNKIKFSYNISIINNEESGDYTNSIKVEGNRLLIRQNFVKSSPCNSINYTIDKNDSVIEIIPKDITRKNREGGCIAMLGNDFIEINLILENGNYTLNIYSLNKQFLIKSRKIIIGKSDSYENCMNKIHIPKEYAKGEVIVDFNENVTEDEIQEFKLNLGSEAIIEKHGELGLIKFSEGNEIGWICNLKDYNVVKDAYFNVIVHAT
jgi:hypothetical protein